MSLAPIAPPQAAAMAMPVLVVPMPNEPAEAVAEPAAAAYLAFARAAWTDVPASTSQFTPSTAVDRAPQEVPLGCASGNPESNQPGWIPAYARMTKLTLGMMKLSTSLHIQG